nr:hypothetical protein [Bradyrhizobium japonicum]
MLAAQSSLMPLRRHLSMIKTSWHKLIKCARDPYRPELHYMRGPGPKWHQKHQGRVESGAL